DLVARSLLPLAAAGMIARALDLGAVAGLTLLAAVAVLVVWSLAPRERWGRCCAARGREDRLFLSEARGPGGRGAHDVRGGAVLPPPRDRDGPVHVRPRSERPVRSAVPRRDHAVGGDPAQGRAHAAPPGRGAEHPAAAARAAAVR